MRGGTKRRRKGRRRERKGEGKESGKQFVLGGWRGSNRKAEIRRFADRVKLKIFSMER